MARIVRAYVELMTERRGLFGVYFEERSHLQPEDLARTRETERGLLHLIEGVYRDGIASGEFRDVDATVAVFGVLGMCFWVYQWYRPDGPLQADEIATALVELAAQGYSIRQVNP